MHVEIKIQTLQNFALDEDDFVSFNLRPLYCQGDSCLKKAGVNYKTCWWYQRLHTKYTFASCHAEIQKPITDMNLKIMECMD